jgi:hypothetical protein
MIPSLNMRQTAMQIRDYIRDTTCVDGRHMDEYIAVLISECFERELQNGVSISHQFQRPQEKNDGRENPFYQLEDGC